MLFWPEISALGVFFNFDNKRMHPPKYPSAPPPPPGRPRTGKNQQESTRIKRNQQQCNTNILRRFATVLGTQIIEACYKNCQESIEHSKTFLGLPEHNKNIQQHMTNKQRTYENQQETCRIFSRTGNFPNSWSLLLWSSGRS